MTNNLKHAWCSTYSLLVRGKKSHPPKDKFPDNGGAQDVPSKASFQCDGLLSSPWKSGGIRMVEHLMKETTENVS